MWILPNAGWLRMHHQRRRRDGQMSANSSNASDFANPVTSSKYCKQTLTNLEEGALGVHSSTTKPTCKRYPQYNPNDSVEERSSSPSFMSPKVEKGWQLKPNARALAPFDASWIRMMVSNLQISPWTTEDWSVFGAARRCWQKLACKSFWLMTWKPANFAPQPKLPRPVHVSTKRNKSVATIGWWWRTAAFSSMMQIGPRGCETRAFKIVIFETVSGISPCNKNCWRLIWLLHTWPPWGSWIKMSATRLVLRPSLSCTSDSS